MASLQLDGQQGLPPAVADSIKDPTVVVEAVEDSASSSSSLAATPEDDVYYPHPTDFELSEHPIDEIRQLKVSVPATELDAVSAADQYRSPSLAEACLGLLLAYCCLSKYLAFSLPYSKRMPIS